MSEPQEKNSKPTRTKCAINSREEGKRKEKKLQNDLVNEVTREQARVHDSQRRTKNGESTADRKLVNILSSKLTHALPRARLNT